MRPPRTQPTDLADLLLFQLRALRLPPPVREHRAIAGRQFRCDLAWPERQLCVEVDGGEHLLGRHSRAAGMASDCEKQNLLTRAGWRCYRFTGSQVKSGHALDFLTSVLQGA